MHYRSDVSFVWHGLYLSVSKRDELATVLNIQRSIHNDMLPSNDKSLVKTIIYMDNTIMVIAENDRHAKFFDCQILSIENSK